MRVRTDPIIRHRDHLRLVEEMIATTEAAVGKQRQKIDQVLRDGGNVVQETNALRAQCDTLRRLNNDRAAVASLVSKRQTTSRTR
jgi:uncharacterized membrane protein